MKAKRIFLTLALLFLGSVIVLCGCSTQTAIYNWVIKTIHEEYYEDLPVGYEYNGSVEDFVDEYLDQYSAFYTLDEYNAVVSSNAGSKSGLGVSYTYVSESDAHPSGKSGILLESVLGNSPAEKAGLKAGEFVLSAEYNGQVTEFTSSSSFSECLSSIPAETEFTLTTDMGTYVVSKQDYTASYCYMATNDAEYRITYKDDSPRLVKEEGESDGISCLPDGVAYLRLDQFYGNAAEEMGMLMEQFNAESCTSLILDLRGNGGGYVSVLADISPIFTAQAKTSYSVCMYAKYKNGTKESIAVGNAVATSREFPSSAKLYVLADNGTASASEALLGVLISGGVLDYEDVYISDLSASYLKRTDMADKNCRTYGKGIMQSTFENKLLGVALKLTTAKIYWPDEKTCIHDTGLTTDMGCKTVYADWDVTYNDEQLALAVAAIF